MNKGTDAAYSPPQALEGQELYVDRCPYSPTGWGWWERDERGTRCTCEPARALTKVEDTPFPSSDKERE